MEGGNLHERPRVRLYLKNLPYRAVERDIGVFCEQAAAGAAAHEIYIAHDGRGRPKGFAFVTLILPLGTPANAWNGLDKQYLAGRQIRVAKAREEGRRDDAPARGIGHGEDVADQ